MPRVKSPDSTLPFLLDPYEFIAKRARQSGTRIFEARLLLRKTICLVGRDGAELFYDTAHFVRRGATPGRIQKTLFGRGGVQGLDGEAHRHRKRMLLSLMNPERIEHLGRITDAWWQTYARKWASMHEVVLYDELQELLSRAVSAWAGVPLPEAEVGQRTRELAALFDKAGSVGPAHWRARFARRRANTWIGRFVEDVRAGKPAPPEDSAAHVIIWHRDLDGHLLSPHVAAVEILNILRPTVAVSVFITFVALALHRYPLCRRKLESGVPGYDEWFVQEVRRFYPFFPAVGARVRQDFEWNGYRFPAGRRVLLDLYGTDHDAGIWPDPDAFRPERFRQWDGDPYELVPQGGGHHRVNHRCPGEWITIELMKRAARFLARELRYEVPEQDLGIDMRRLPALPRSRFVMTKVSLEEPEPLVERREHR